MELFGTNYMGQTCVIKRFPRNTALPLFLPSYYSQPSIMTVRFRPKADLLLDIVNFEIERQHIQVNDSSSGRRI